jgi:hypothetical protein
MTGSHPSECCIIAVERQHLAVIKANVPIRDIPQAERSARAKLKTLLPSLNAGTIGHELTLWRPPADGKLSTEIGVIAERRFATEDGIEASEMPAGRTAHYVLNGPYDGMGAAWRGKCCSIAARPTA